MNEHPGKWLLLKPLLLKDAIGSKLIATTRIKRFAEITSKVFSMKRTCLSVLRVCIQGKAKAALSSSGKNWEINSGKSVRDTET